MIFLTIRFIVLSVLKQAFKTNHWCKNGASFFCYSLQSCRLQDVMQNCTFGLHREAFEKEKD